MTGYLLSCFLLISAQQKTLCLVIVIIGQLLN